jgi:hypothetical protein
MDTLGFYLLHHERAHEGMVWCLETGVTEEQIRRRPHETVNSLAWLLWHVARTEDVCLNRFVADRRQVFDEEDWMPRLNVARRDIGQGMTFAEVDDLSGRLDLAAARSYWSAVGCRTVEIIRELRLEDLDTFVGAAHVEQVIEGDGVVRGDDVPRIRDFWSGLTRGYFLGYLGLTHTFAHLGEADTICGLYGIHDI